LSPADPGGPAAEALYGEAACGLVLTDGNGKIQRANATFCRWLGIEEPQLRERRFQDLLGTGARIFHQTHWAPLLQMQGSISEVKLDVRHADGRLLPMVLNAVRRVEAGVVRHELAVFSASDRHSYELELLRARRQAESLLAEQQDRALFAEQMVGIVSHDLRTPLSAISMGAELLGRLGPTPQQTQIVENLQRSARRSRRLIDDLLDFTMARIGRGLKIKKVPVELHALVANQVHELSLAYPRHELRHVAKGQGEVSADADRIFQLIGNLVANAAAYGAKGRPITITTSFEHGLASVAVHNFGPAIPVHLLPTLFQPMVRGTDAPSDTRSVGLGLYIASEIAHAHGGGITVSSSQEEGTRFEVTLQPGEPAKSS
jgi:sigma-B regulation protein RsbU (phosphoserine phosphatase)